MVIVRVPFNMAICMSENPEICFSEYALCYGNSTLYDIINETFCLDLKWRWWWWKAGKWWYDLHTLPEQYFSSMKDVVSKQPVQRHTVVCSMPEKRGTTFNQYTYHSGKKQLHILYCEEDFIFFFWLNKVALCSRGWTGHLLISST